MSYKPPKWLGGIPQGTHGSGIVQKKYWKVVSDTVRIRDFYAFGDCISCETKFHTWNESQAGHYKSWGSCRGYSKWNMMNIFAQCKICNSVGSKGFVSAKDTNVIGGNFKDNIRKRYGEKRIKLINALDKHPSEKMEDHVIVEMIKDIIILMKDLPEQPDYWKKAYDQILAEN